MSKAQVANQFNWIFVLIVGGLFLALFFTMSTKQGKISETRVSATALEGITTIFESARTGNSLSTIIEIPELTMGFSCEYGLFNSDTIYSAYTVEGLSKQIPALPTFAPEKLIGNDLSTWTQTWKFPYMIQNFLYIANSKTRFFFIFDRDFFELQEELNATFSRNMKAEYLSSISELADYNDDLSIVVLVTSDSIDAANIRDVFENTVQIIQVVPDSRSYEFGTLYFNADENKKSYYYGMASLYGALFSGNKEYYECSMRKAEERFKRVSCVQMKKYQLMSEAYANDVECKLAYDTALLNMQTFFGADFCDAENTIDTGTELFDFSIGLENEYYYVNAMDDTNTRTITKSCELLY
jgi:hypothetical protein